MAEYRQWRETNRTMLKDAVPLDTPYNLQIETSSLCNINCVYCAHSQKKHGVWEGNMSFDILTRILEDAKYFPRKFKLFDMFGFGEPLCNPSLAKMISMVKEANVTEKISFTTNGLLFNKKNVDEIIASGVDTIRISLQGLNANDYKRFCGVSIDFDKFISNLQYLYNHKGACKIRMKIADIAMQNTCKKEALEKIFGKIADSLFIETILPMYLGIDYDDVDENINKKTIHGRENVFQSEVHTVCHRPFYRLRVAANGEVTAACCDKPHDFHYGNIAHSHLYEIWNGSKHRTLLKMQLEGNRFLHPVCKKCVMANDITSEKDILDPWADELLKKMNMTTHSIG